MEGYQHYDDEHNAAYRRRHRTRRQVLEDNCNEIVLVIFLFCLMIAALVQHEQHEIAQEHAVGVKNVTVTTQGHWTNINTLTADVHSVQRRSEVGEVPGYVTIDASTTPAMKWINSTIGPTPVYGKSVSLMTTTPTGTPAPIKFQRLPSKSLNNATVYKDGNIILSNKAAIDDNTCTLAHGTRPKIGETQYCHCYYDENADGEASDWIPNAIDWACGDFFSSHWLGRDFHQVLVNYFPKYAELETPGVFLTVEYWAPVLGNDADQIVDNVQGDCIPQAISPGRCKDGFKTIMGMCEESDKFVNGQGGYGIDSCLRYNIDLSPSVNHPGLPISPHSHALDCNPAVATSCTTTNTISVAFPPATTDYFAPTTTTSSTTSSRLPKPNCDHRLCN